MDAELICLRGIESFWHSTLPEVVRTRTRFADAVAPVVSVGEAASGPAKVGCADALHVVDELFPDAIDVWDFGVAYDPHTVVDHAAEVFDEVSVDVRADDCAGFAESEFDFCIGGEGKIAGCDCAQCSGGTGFDKCASVHRVTAISGRDSTPNCGRGVYLHAFDVRD